MIVVTGGAGRVGRQVVAQLAELGQPVRVLSRGMRPGLAPSGAEMMRADLTDPGSIVSSARNCSRRTSRRR
jgi:uncharacterized protein YbjT (DUF2867 family)